MSWENCDHQKYRCIDSRAVNGYRRRSYQCQECLDRWTTIEVPFNFQVGPNSGGAADLIKLASLGSEKLGKLTNALQVLKDAT